MNWNVVGVRVIAPLALQVRFEHSHLTSVFAALNDPAVFRKVYVDGGAVTWPGDVDLAPGAMYSEIKARGEWVLR